MTNIVQLLGGSQCVNCHTWRIPSNLETVTIGSDTFHVCEDCTGALDGPGKHEAIHESDRALCVALEWLAGNSWEDHSLVDEYNGYMGLFDRHILQEDSSGFITVESYPDANKAMAWMDTCERDGMGATEYDGWIGQDGYHGHWYASLDGKHIGKYPRRNRAIAALALAMRDSGYWPNTWEDQERGYVHMIDVPYLEPGQVAPSQATLDAMVVNHA